MYDERSESEESEYSQSRKKKRGNSFVQIKKSVP